jgi:hypothetical protein
MIPETENLSASDLYAISRACFNFPLTDPEKLSERGRAIVSVLLAAHPLDREMLIKRKLSSREVDALYSIDPKDEPPSAPKEILSTSKGWVIMDVNGLNAIPPLRWIIPQEVPDECLVVLFGESGVGKSFIGVDYALRIAQTDRVVYIPTEGISGYKKRIAAWCNHHKRSPGSLSFVVGSINLFDRGIFDALKADIQPLKPRMVVIDTLAMAMVGADENSARDMGRVVAACRSLMYDCKTTVMLVHHIGKAGFMERGSTALRGNSDVMIRLSPADDMILMECSKTKDEEPFLPRYLNLLPVQTEHGESRVPIRAEKVIPVKGVITKNQRSLLEIMALEVNADGISMRELQEVTGISLGSIQRALSTMLKFGYVWKHSSYCISNEGRQLIGADPVDPPRPRKLDRPKTRNFPSLTTTDPGESGDPLESDEDQNFGNESGGSRGSADHMDQSRPLFGEVFGETPKRRSKNQYDFGS